MKLCLFNRRQSMGIMLGLLLLPSLALALQSDKNQETTIDANQMTYNEKQNVNVFSGNVLMTRGSLVIRGDKLTLSQPTTGQQFAKIEGSPARFRQQRDSTRPKDILLIQGSAKTIEFDSNKGTVTLSGQATLEKTTNGEITESLTGSTIVYDQNSQSLTVQGDATGSRKNRVQAVIKPKPIEP